MYISNSKKNVLFALLFQFVSLIFGFYIRKLLLSNVDILLIGLNNVYENIISMISLLNFGIGSASIYYLYKYFSNNDKNKSMLYYQAFEKLFRYVAAGVFALGLIIMLLIDFLVDTSNINPILVRAFFLIQLLKVTLNFLITCPRYALQCDEKRYYNLIGDIASLVIFGILKAISIIVTKNYAMYLILSILEMVASNLYINICFRSKYSWKIKFSKQEISTAIKDITNYGKKLAIENINHFINNCTDNILLSKICGTYSVAILSNYYTIIEAIKNFIMQLFASIESTAIKKLNLTENEKDYIIIYRITTIISYSVSSFTSIFLFILADCFVFLFFGPQFSIGTIVPLLMVCNLIVTIFQYPSSYLIKAKGLENKIVVFSTFMMASNILLSIILGISIGKEGILFATIIANSILLIGEDFVASKYVIKKNKKSFFIKYCLLILNGVELFICSLFIPENYTILSFVSLTIIAFVLCAVSIIPFTIKNKSLLIDFFK